MDYPLSVGGTAIPNRRLFISSTDKKLSSDTPGNFSIELKNGDLQIPEGKDVLIGLITASVPSSFYSVNSSNNTFVFTVAGDTGQATNNGIYTVTLRPANYSGTSLATELKRACEDALAVVDDNTFIDTAYLADFNTITFGYKSNNNSGTYTINVSNAAFTSQNITGFKSNATANSDGSLLTSTVIDLSGPSAVLVHCDQLESNVWSRQDGNNSTILAIIGVTGERFRSTIYAGYPVGINRLTAPVSVLRFIFTDERNNVIDFNGVATNLTLGVYIVDKKSGY